MPLVLVQNERTATGAYDHWKDLTGVQYHFPNQYKNRMVTGTPFVYYQGVRRAKGRRGAAEYFGCGVIGEVWRDTEIPESEPKRRWAWYCRIEDYVPFAHAVPARIDGEFIEQIPPNFWSVAVRALPADAYQRILVLAGLASIAATEAPKAEVLPPIDAVRLPARTERLLFPVPERGEGQGGRGGARYSRASKLAGDRAEEIVCRYLERLGHKVRWVARDRETPGWDIEYRDKDGALVAVEVKGSSAGAFTSVEITDGEWAAAQRLRERYWLYLVSDCMGTTPKIQSIHNPSGLAGEGTLLLSPIRWRLAQSSDEGVPS